MIDLCEQIEKQSKKMKVNFFDIAILLQKLERAYFDSVMELKKLIINLGNHTNQKTEMNS